MSEDQIYQALKEKFRQSLLGELMSGICHEVNNPLTILLGNQVILDKFLRKDPLPSIDKLLSFNKEIENSAVRILNITTTLKLLGKVDQQEEMSNEIIDNLLTQAQVILKTKFNRQKVEFILQNFPCNEKIKCRAGHIIEAIIQIILNRIENLEGTENKKIIFTPVAKDNKLNILITDSIKKFTQPDLDYLEKGQPPKPIPPDFRLVIARESLEQNMGSLKLINQDNNYGLMITLPITSA